MPNLKNAKKRVLVIKKKEEENNKFAATMNDFAQTVASLGENKRLEDLRCKN